MPNKGETKERKRMVVEEVKVEDALKEEEKKVVVSPEPEILEEAAKDTISIESQPQNKVVAEEIKPKKSPSIIFWIIIPGIFLLGAILGGIVF
mgnify:CR=1 FL=1